MDGGHAVVDREIEGAGARTDGDPGGRAADRSRELRDTHEDERISFIIRD